MLWQKAIGGTAAGPRLTGYQFLASFDETTDVGSFTQSYSNVPFGTPQSDRYILGVAYSSCSQSNTLDINSATFGGISATRSVYHNALGGFNFAAYFLANVPTGSSGDVSWGATLTAGTSGRRHIVLYAMYGAPTVVSDNFSSSGVVSSSNQSAILSGISTDDIIFALAGNNAAGTRSWSPAYLGTDFNVVFDTNRRRTVVSGTSTSSGSQTISVNLGVSRIQANLSAAALRL